MGCSPAEFGTAPSRKPRSFASGSILNRIQKHSSFVYETVRLVEHPRLTLEVRVRPRAGARARCGRCRRRAPGYDTQARRRFDFVPLWHIPVVFDYAMRRVSCPRCGVHVEAVPWATGKHRVTDAHAWFLAGWAKRLSWHEVAEAFPTSWDTVHRAVRMAVDWGLAHRDLSSVAAIGVDELARRRGHRYLTLVYQIDRHHRRLLWVGRERKAATLQAFFDWFGAARSEALRFVCSDMWKPYLAVVAERAGQAVHVLDRFHIMSHFSKAIDEVRAAEVRKLAAEGRAPVLKHSRWVLLKRPEHLTDTQEERLSALVRRNLRTVRAYLLKSLWRYVSPYWAGRFLDRWCTRTMRSRLDPIEEGRNVALHPRSLWHVAADRTAGRSSGTSELVLLHLDRLARNPPSQACASCCESIPVLTNGRAASSRAAAKLGPDMLSNQDGRAKW